MISRAESESAAPAPGAPAPVQTARWARREAGAERRPGVDLGGGAGGNAAGHRCAAAGSPDRWHGASKGGRVREWARAAGE